MSDAMVKHGSNLNGATFSPDGLYRYELWRRWDYRLGLSSGPTLGWVMLNPSTADHTENDPTIRRCIGFAQRWGYGGIHVVNLFAWRATKPADLLLTDDPIGPANDSCLRNLHARCDLIVAAWGAHKLAESRAERVLDLVRPRKVVCLGSTKSGAPRHPLYVPNDTDRTDYLATEYDEEFGISLDPCEHASRDGDGKGGWVCMACGAALKGMG